MVDKYRLEGTLIRHEGHHNVIYKDALGVPTVGVGRNVTRPFHDDEITLMLRNDIAEALRSCEVGVKGFKELNSDRQEVLVNMVFNLGWPRFSEFTLLRHFVFVQNFDRAAEEMLDSLWADQVGKRAEELARVMRTGRWDNGI